jgi:hypothetical protein
MIEGLFRDGGNWESALAVTPPPFFVEDVGFLFATDGAGVGDTSITFIGDFTLLPGQYVATLHVQDNPQSESLYIAIDYSVGVTPFQTLLPVGNVLGVYEQPFTLPTGVTAFSVSVLAYNGVTYVTPTYLNSTLQVQPQGKNGQILVNGGSSDYTRFLCYDAPVDYNTGLFSDPTTKTLGQLKLDLLARLGYSAQGYPPGMEALLTSFLQDAQEQAYWRYPVLHTEKWFPWQTQVGQRFYDVPIDCTKYLNFRRVTAAFLQDDDAWFPLVAGINPLLFNQTMNSLPQYYELREALELWPAPDKATYIIWLKGHIGLMPLEADDDRTTIDSRVVFLAALANAKAHYGQPDAGRYDREVEILIGRMAAGTHYTKRYIPGEKPKVGLPLPIREVPGG